MKKLVKISSYILTTMLVIFISQSSAYASGNVSNNGALTGTQILGGLGILLLVILVPLVKKSRRLS
jgi:hypothetical protein